MNRDKPSWPWYDVILSRSTTARGTVSHNFVACRDDTAEVYDRQALEASVSLYQTALARVQRFLEAHNLTEAFEAFERDDR